MKQNKKIIIIASIIICIIVIICIISIILVNKKNKGKNNDVTSEDIAGTPDAGVPEGNPGITYKLEELRDPGEFFSVENAIKKYKNSNFIAYEIKMLNGEEIVTYVVDGGISSDSNNEQNSNENNNISLNTSCIERIKNDSTKLNYYIVRVDVVNMTCEITEAKADNIDDVKFEESQTPINDNGNNSFEYIQVTEEQAARMYYEEINNLELNNPNIIYSMLDDEYRKVRFPSYETYEKYVNELKNRIEISTITKYSVDNKEDYREYYAVDNYNNTYIIRAKSVKDYTILLDNYSIKTDDFKKKYNELSDEDKAKTDIHIFIEMINTKDYANAYNLFTEEFKKSYFDTEEKFESYINEYWFDYNIENVNSAESRGNVYMCGVNIKDSASSAANQKNITINIQLNDDSNFALSFDPGIDYEEPHS